MATRKTSVPKAKGKAAQPKGVAVPRYDFLTNDFLGYGTGRDKIAAGAFNFNANQGLTDTELDALYYSDDVASRIVNLKPTEMLRAGYTLCSKKDPERAKELQAKGKALNLDLKLLRGMQWGRLRGGAVVLIGALDGTDNLATPLRLDKVKEVSYLNPIDRRFATVRTWQGDYTKPEYTAPEIYGIGTIGTYVDVHASRLIRFEGVPETDPFMMRQLGGWTFSALQRVYDVIRKFATTYESAAQLMADASQGVWSIQGLLDAISNNKEALYARMTLADMTRSAGRAIMVDSETEGFTRVATPLAGVDVIIDRFVQRLAAAAEMPVTLLMGTSPAGMIATGDADFRAWYGTVKSGQINDLKPILLRTYTIIGAGDVPDDLDVEFHPLWEQTDEQLARTENIRAQTDKIYVDLGACNEQQVAIARFGSGEGRIQVDEDALWKSLDVEAEFAAKLQEAKDELTDKDLAAVALAKNTPPAVVSALISAGITEEPDESEPAVMGPIDPTSGLPNAPPPAGGQNPTQEGATLQSPDKKYPEGYDTSDPSPRR